MNHHQQQQEIEEEPPSYDHAVQTALEPSNAVYEWGRFRDASADSFERGELFTQAFRSQLDQYPEELAKEIREHGGFLNCVRLDLATHSNHLFRHNLATPQSPPFQLLNDGFTVQFWPSAPKNRGSYDWDVTVQATHPFLHDSVTAVHYFEATVEQLSPDTVLAIGLTTRPYPLFRMPGWNKYSVGYHSDDGRKFLDDGTGGQDYGPSWAQGDTVGCGYRPQEGTVFFTLNGRFISNAFSGLEPHHYFASIGADGTAKIRINFGQTPFLFAVQQ